MSEFWKVLAVGISAGVIGGAASAQDPVKLRLATHIAVTAPGVVEGTNVFMKAVEEASGGSITFDFYPAEQAGKALQTFDLVKAGAVDIGYVSTGYTSNDKLPLVGVWEIPGLADSVCDVVAAMFVVGSPGGVIYENNFKPNGVRMLGYNPYPPYGFAASSRPIDSVEDVQGLKARTAGGLMDMSVERLGAVPVRMSAAELYESLQRGTIDAVVASYLTVDNYRLAEVAKYGTAGFSFGTPGEMITISDRVFQSLSKEQQEALLKAGKLASDHWCTFLDKAEQDYKARLQAGGMEIHIWTEEQLAELHDLTADVPVEWAQTLDSRGLPGTETLEAFQKALPHAGQ
jgi:TRAP-type C4-dicarboxylate transport system substrate-binding protein